MNYKKIIFILGVLLPGYGFCNPRIDDFQNLLSLVCTDSNFSATSELQMEVAKQRMESSQTDTWMPELTVGVDVFKAEGQPTSFFAVQNGAVQDPAEPNFFQRGEGWLGKVDLNLSIYDDGQWVGQDGIKQSTAKTEYQIAKAKNNNSHREAIQMVSQYYFNALMYSAQIDLLTPQTKKRKAQLDDIQTKISAGVNTKEDFYTANAGYLSLNEQLKQALRQRAINASYLQLVTNTQLELNTGEKGSSLLELAKIINRDLQLGDLNTLIENHPEVRILAAKLALEKDKLDEYYGKLMPNLNLYVKLRTADDFDDALRQDYAEVGLAFEYPIGDIARNNGETKALRKSVTAIGVELAYLKKMKLLQASTISGDLLSAQGSISVANVQLTRRQQKLDSDLLLVDSGLIALDDLIRSEDDKISAELNLLTAYKFAWTEYVKAVVFTESACLTSL
ncbi:MAG: outer membrane protein TolC [Paraglaciecola sp.]